MPVAASRGRRDRVERQPGRAHVVVRGAARDHAERDAEPPGQLGDRRDRAVAAGHDEPLGRGVRRRARGPRSQSNTVTSASIAADERLGVEPSARGPVGDQRDAHDARSVEPSRSRGSGGGCRISPGGTRWEGRCPASRRPHPTGSSQENAPCIASTARSAPSWPPEPSPPSPPPRRRPPPSTRSRSFPTSGAHALRRRQLPQRRPAGVRRRARLERGPGGRHRRAQGHRRHLPRGPVEQRRHPGAAGLLQRGAPRAARRPDRRQPLRPSSRPGTGAPNREPRSTSTGAACRPTAPRCTTCTSCCATTGHARNARGRRRRRARPTREDLTPRADRAPRAGARPLLYPRSRVRADRPHRRRRRGPRRRDRAARADVTGCRSSTARR